MTTKQKSLKYFSIVSIVVAAIYVALGAAGLGSGHIPGFTVDETSVSGGMLIGFGAVTLIGAGMGLHCAAKPEKSLPGLVWSFVVLAYECVIGFLCHTGDGPVIDPIEYPMFLFALGMVGFFTAVYQEQKAQKK